MEWINIRDERKRKIGYICEVCNEPNLYLIGHHILPKKLMSKYRIYDIDLCEIRCASCEVHCHKIYPNGNRPENQKVLQELLRLLKQERRNKR